MQVFFSTLTFGQNFSIEQVSKVKCDGYHLDVMDGTVVPNLCRHDFFIQELKSLGKPIQVHLMGSQALVKSIAAQKPDIVFVHPKWCEDLDNAVSELRRHNVKIGIVWDADGADTHFNSADEALFMTVVPGFGGQELLQSRLPMIKKLLPNKPSWVDGGINADTIKYFTGLDVSIIVGAGLQSLRGGLL
jgi:ribulose-phosphate 3-epimerase